MLSLQEAGSRPCQYERISRSVDTIDTYCGSDVDLSPIIFVFEYDQVFVECRYQESVILSDGWENGFWLPVFEQIY